MYMFRLLLKRCIIYRDQLRSWWWKVSVIGISIKKKGGRTKDVKEDVC